MRSVLILLISAVAFCAYADVHIYSSSAVVLRDIKPGTSFFWGYNEPGAECLDGYGLRAVYESEPPEDCAPCEKAAEAEAMYTLLMKASAEKSAAEAVVRNIDNVSLSADDPELVLGNMMKYQNALSESSMLEAERRESYNRLMEELRIITSVSKGEPEPYTITAGECSRAEFTVQGIMSKYENFLDVNEDGNGEAGLRVRLTNRSGFDIKGEDSILFDGDREAALRIPAFRRWVVRPIERPHEAERMLQTESADFAVKRSAVNAPSVPEPVREGDYIFRIPSLTLPSDGVEKAFVLDSAEVEADYRLAVYPYDSPRVYRETSFTPPFEIYGDLWRVHFGKERFSRIRARFDEGELILPLGHDKTVIVQRGSLPGKREGDGFFGGKKKLSRGYFIELSNTSSDNKEVVVIDRVPVSADDRVSVRNISISGTDAVPDDDGRIEFTAPLEAGETKRYEVTFEITADKDMDVNIR
ncbi:DUF4139 domain-containing protein [Limisalsivibrio acetivorans]|uniref:DUF4139 domain-containing protein n=1 Tax=Limisalsivibrio acetivorans TaxID=1304888 RepID=UPI0003B62A08|nr:DUF4139 domain-containing protein [Limisalsivibrio acetivorans]